MRLKFMLGIAALSVSAFLLCGCASGARHYELDYYGAFSEQFHGVSLAHGIWRGSCTTIADQRIAIYDELYPNAHLILFMDRPPKGEYETGLLESKKKQFDAYLVYGQIEEKDNYGNVIPNFTLLNRLLKGDYEGIYANGGPYICKLAGNLRLKLKPEDVAESIVIDLQGQIALDHVIPTSNGDSVYSRRGDLIVPTDVILKGTFVGEYGFTNKGFYVPI